MRSGARHGLGLVLSFLLPLAASTIAADARGDAPPGSSNPPAPPGAPANPPPIAPVHGQPAPLARETPPLRKVTFSEALQTALERNPDAGTALQEIQRADAIAYQARGAFMPTLVANGTYTRLDHDRKVGTNVVTPGSSLNGNITLNVPVISAQRWMRWQEAKLTTKVLEQNEKEVKRQLVLAAGRAYLQLLVQHSLLDTSTLSRDNSVAHEKYAHDRYAGGIGNRIDEARAAREAATSEARLESARVNLVRAQESLGVLMGVDGPVDADGGDLQLGSTGLAEGLDGAAHRRGDVAAAEARKTFADKVVRDSWADYAPMLSIIAYPFVQDPATTTLPNTGWQAQAVLSIPLYDGGVRYGARRERKALAEEARLAIEGRLRQARSEVRSAFESIQSADLALEAARNAEKLALESLDLANKAYRAGAVTNIEVIDAERNARDAGVDVAVAADTARQARLDFLVASGHFPGMN